MQNFGGTVYVFELVSLGSDLDGEEWSFTAATRAEAEARADARLVDTFGLASPERRAVTSVRFVRSEDRRHTRAA